MAKTSTTQTLTVVFDTEGDETVRVSVPNPANNVTTQMTSNILNAAKTTVSGGKTVLQSKSNYDVTGIRESYITYTQKTWVDDPPSNVSVDETNDGE